MPRHSRTPVRIATVAALTIVGLTAGVAPVAAEGPTARRSPGTVEVKAFRFRPATIEVAAGTKVVWRNRDQIEHTVTGTGDASAIDGTLRRAGAKYAARLEVPGTYEYFCARHPSMTGTVVVRGA